MRNGLSWVRQHLIPVVPAKAFSIDPHSTDSYDLVVANSIIVHNGDEQAHLVHVFWGDVKDDGLVVDGV